MKLTTLEETDSDLVLVLSGGLDYVASKEIEGSFREATRDLNKTIILDVSDVDFLTSAGLRIFLEIHKERAWCRRKVILLQPQPSVRKLLEISGLSSVLSVVNTLDEARAV